MRHADSDMKWQDAAAAIGDDRIQRQTRGTVVPESFTQGSSVARVSAFKRGLDGGNVAAGRLTIR
jgi:predicted metalloprotease